MKNIITIFITLIGSFLIHGQEKFKEREIDFEVKNDSVNFIKTKDYLIDENNFGSKKSVLNFSLISNNDVLYLQFQSVESNDGFIPVKCFDRNSKIFIQLQNGKIITLFSTEERCSELFINSENNFQTRVLTNYFLFSKNNFDDLYTSPISMIRVKYGTEQNDFVPKKILISEHNNVQYSPEDYFINNLSIFK